MMPDDSMKSDDASDYLTAQIIAYIGNKRRLLPLIEAALARAYGGEAPKGLKFLDLFAGSGIVSRFAKRSGFSVVCNDWEPYAFTLNRAFVGTNRRDIDRLFGSYREFLDLLDHLNNLPEPAESDRYISLYYAPASDDLEKADFRRERLFYTRANALTIDKIRGEIDRIFPADAGGDSGQKRDLLIAPLLYEAATHTNTSGVFKAFHKGFGGHGRDALKRILGPIMLKPPPLIDSEAPCRVFGRDAAELARSPEASGVDVAYLDPPYNQHQYGSNYHMLNTIALWDKPSASLDLNEKGVLKNKAAIRRDWILTRSDYCYAEKAGRAFEDLLLNLDAEHILISYSTDGLIPWNELEAMCRRRGRVAIVANSYTKYRGGKQSNSRGNGNVEFVFIVSPRASSAFAPNGGEEVRKIFALSSVRVLFKSKFCAAALARNFDLLPGGAVRTRLRQAEILINGREYFTLEPPRGLEDLSLEDLEILRAKLRDSACPSKAAELEELLSKIRGGDPADWIRLLPGVLKKLAHKKNRELFFHYLSRVKDLENECPDAYTLIRPEVDRVEEIARLRFAG